MIILEKKANIITSVLDGRKALEKSLFNIIFEKYQKNI